MIRLFVVLVADVLVTLPFGFYRAYTRKLSLRWFLAIHVPVILIVLARYEAHLSYVFIPFTCVTFAGAQYVGGRVGRWWIKRHSVALAPGQPTVPPPPGSSHDPRAPQNVYHGLRSQSDMGDAGS
ncbi:MAG: hypothetical protein M1274_06285 [Actinobacteria bacterium]|nr:hypothetical protein [Actinomycetota bacterium]